MLQDLYWPESLAAAMLTDRFTNLEAFRETIAEEAYRQPSLQVRQRYAAYFIKWFLPGLSFHDPVARCWRGFHDALALEHVMRWQFVTSNPLIAGFVDDHLSHAEPGSQIDELAESYLASVLEVPSERTRQRIRANLRKVGLIAQQGRGHYRVQPDVSPRAIALLLAALFAPQAQVVSMEALVANPWWKRLGVLDESGLRQKLKETAERGLIARVLKMDTLDQVTTRYSLAELTAGMAGQ